MHWNEREREIDRLKGNRIKKKNEINKKNLPYAKQPFFVR